ncbi:MAG: hypothetical protein J6L99_02165 [Ruminococcus sp.]|jgi:hypothetical protein|nr:hypothetical protein [Ruminococcus sp.]
MTHLLNIDEAIDRKFLVAKSMKGQAEQGTIIHVLDGEQAADGSINVWYRVTHFNEKFHDYQDYQAKFKNLAEFCKWAQPDNFIARHYEKLNIKDIQHYLKVKNRSFTTFCLPIILIAAVIIWIIAFVAFEGTLKVVVGVVLTVVAAVAILFIFKGQKKHEKIRLYEKVSSTWGVVIK